MRIGKLLLLQSDLSPYYPLNTEWLPPNGAVWFFTSQSSDEALLLAPLTHKSWTDT